MNISVKKKIDSKNDNDETTGSDEIKPQTEEDKTISFRAEKPDEGDIKSLIDWAYQVNSLGPLSF